MILFVLAPLSACLTVVALFAAAPVSAQQHVLAALPAPPDTQVVAEVNGSKIFFKDVRLAYENLPQQYKGMPIAQIYQPLVQQLTERRLVLMAAEAAKLAEEPEVAGMIKQARNRILEQSLISREVNAASTEVALRAQYEAEKGKLDGAANEIRASHILVETEEEADAIVAQLYKGGDFAKLAMEKSKGPSGAKGGDLGYFTKDKMVPEFANAAFDLQPGDISAPVKTGFGWHIIKVVDRRKGGGASFAKRAPELRQAIAKTVVAKLLDELSKEAEIKVYKMDGKPVEAMN